jgi:hypothetical protein
MNLQEIKTKQLKIMMKSFSNVSLGVRDIMLIQLIEDELERRSN